MTTPDLQKVRDAIDAAFAERVQKLFAVLCDGIITGELEDNRMVPRHATTSSTALDRFGRGLAVARRAREMALSIVGTGDGDHS